MIDEVREGCLIEKCWYRWKKKVIAENGIGRGKNDKGQRHGGQMR